MPTSARIPERRVTGRNLRPALVSTYAEGNHSFKVTCCDLRNRARTAPKGIQLHAPALPVIHPHPSALIPGLQYTSGGVLMRTNIVIDPKLVREAMKLAGARTMREAVDIALRRFVQSGRQRKLLDLHASGGVRKDYDYKRARSSG